MPVLTYNPFADISAYISSDIMQAFVILMILFVAGGTIFDVIHKKSAKYFFDAAQKSKERGDREVAGIHFLEKSGPRSDVILIKLFVRQHGVVGER